MASTFCQDCGCKKCGLPHELCMCDTSKKKKKKCYACNGDGMIICPECKGTGE